MKITETARVCEELCRLLEEKDVSLGYFRIKRVRGRLFFLSMLTVRIVVLEYSQLIKRL